VAIGDVKGETLDCLCGELEKSFGRGCTMAAALPQPNPAHNERRGQHLSSCILQQLSHLELPHSFRVLGVADLDLYVPELNCVFGQATKGGRDAVIALPRLGQSFYGLRNDEEVFLQRVLKKAIHELGHTLGLEHCPDWTCVMQFSNRCRPPPFLLRISISVPVITASSESPRDCLKTTPRGLRTHPFREWSEVSHEGVGDSVSKSVGATSSASIPCGACLALQQRFHGLNFLAMIWPRSSISPASRWQ